MLENLTNGPDYESEMRTVISIGETITYGELRNAIVDTSKIKFIDAEMLYMDTMECILEIATICHDVTSGKVYLMCKSCAPMHHSLVDNILDVRLLDENCVFLDSKDPRNLLNIETDDFTQIWMAVHSHTHDMLFMVAPITIIGPGSFRFSNGMCASRDDVVSLWGEM